MNGRDRQPVRNHVFFDLTRSLCPVCLRTVDAQVLLRNGSVYLRKRCPEHGWHEALVSNDAAWYTSSLKYNKPGAIPQGFATEVQEGCPRDCGLCPEHQQHTCVGVIEVTTRCDLNCAACFAGTGGGHDLSLAQVEAILDRLLVTEKRPEVVQISGGEPTLHPQILELLGAAKARKIGHVMLNTNGLRIAEDRAFVERLAQLNPSIYLQFDGLRPHTHETLRGADLVSVKQRALDTLADLGMNAVLVATIVRGVNEDEIGDILQYGLRHPAVRGVVYQPATFAGRCLVQHDPLDRTTVPDVLHALETQTEGLFRVSDFVPVPCPYPTCTACTYAYIDSHQVVPITRLVDVDDYLDFVANRTIPGLSEELQPVLEALWSMAAAIGSEKTAQDLACCACNVTLPPGFVEAKDHYFKEHVFMVQVHAFMDEHTFDLKRLMKCCIHQLTPDGHAVPLCAYNTLGRRDQVRREQEGSQ